MRVSNTSGACVTEPAAGAAGAAWRAASPDARSPIQASAQTVTATGRGTRLVGDRMGRRRQFMLNRPPRIMHEHGLEGGRAGQRETGRPHLAPRAGGGASLAPCVGLLAFGLAAAAQTPPASTAPSRPADRIPLSRLTPDAVIPISAGAGIAVTADGLWVAADDRAGGAPRRGGDQRGEPPRSGSGTPRAPRWPRRSTAVWVPVCAAKMIARVDPAKGTPTAEVALAPAAAAGQIAVAVGSLWVAVDDAGVVARIDPATNAAVAEVYVARHPVAVSGGDDGVWISSEDGDVVTRVNAYTNAVVETVKVGPRPGRIAVGEGGVWVLNRGDGSVTRIDPKTTKVVATIAVDPAVAEGEIAAGEGSVWISAPRRAAAAHRSAHQPCRPALRWRRRRRGGHRPRLGLGERGAQRPVAPRSAARRQHAALNAGYCVAVTGAAGGASPSWRMKNASSAAVSWTRTLNGSPRSAACPAFGW